MTDMRDAFFASLYDIIKEDKNVLLLTADHGAFGVRKIQDDFPNQYLNVGIAEQNVMSIASGLTLSGKIIYVYGINNFITLRCLEQIVVDIASMNLHVNIVGVGSGFTYCTDGFTHHGIQDVAVMSTIPNFKIYNCSDAVNTAAFAKLGYYEQGPKYIRIEKGTFPELYDSKRSLKSYSGGIEIIRKGEKTVILTSGRMVHRAVAASDELLEEGKYVGVLDIYRLKPFPTTLLIDFIRSSDKLIVLEDNVSAGGLGDKVCSALIDNRVYIPTIKWNAGDQFCFEYSTDREWVEEQMIKERL